jgi:peptidoglycan/xylan/chitin deacetylase (PgdA/CDA1 family)
MRLVSPLLKRVVYPSLSRCGYLRRAAHPGIAVVTYHGVLPAGYHVTDPTLDGNLVSSTVLRRQLSFLKRRYHVLRPEEFLLWCEGTKELPPHSVLLTCDDGLKNTLTEMLPVLQELDLECLFFITGASFSEAPQMLWYERLYLMFLSAPESIAVDLEEIGIHRRARGRQQKHALWWELVRELSAFDFTVRCELLECLRSQLGIADDWDAALRSDPARRSRFCMLDVEELRQLAAAGMSIGAHTLSHPVLSLAPPELAWKEISDSRKCLEQLLGIPIPTLAYPFGDPSSVSPREFEMAARAGFTCAFVNAGGGLGAETPLFAFPRIHVTATMGLSEFEAHVSGFYRTLRKRLRSGNEAAGAAYA